MKLSFVILLVLTSCVSLNKEFVLSQAGKKVRMVDYLSPQDKKNLIEFNMVRCDMNTGIGTLDQNIMFCGNKMRNQAAIQGASVLLLEPEKQKYGNSAFRTFDNVSQCNSCLSMRGLIYREK